MGCDGGTIPKRDELVKKKKKPEQKDKKAELAAKWQLCAIKQQELLKPIVACELGKLYNKVSVLETLLDKGSASTDVAVASHIRSIKDVKELNLTVNPAYATSDQTKKGDESGDDMSAKYICPVTSLEMNGKHRFCFIWTCGCVVSERAVKEVQTQSCHVCTKPFTASDVIIINGSDEDVTHLREAMESRRLLAKQEKKAKKADKRKIQPQPEDKISTDKMVNGPSTSKINKPNNNDSTQRNGKLNGEVKQDNVKSTVRDSLLVKEIINHTTNIQKDPKASKVLKSLFTSSTGAQGQEKAHWITSNPFYMR